MYLRFLKTKPKQKQNRKTFFKDVFAIVQPMLLLHIGNHVLFTSCFKDNFKICKTQCSDDKRLFDTMLLPALLLNICLFVLTKYFMTSSQMFFCPALLLNQRVQLLTSSLKRGDQPEKSLSNINMWHRQRKGNRCMSGSKKIDVESEMVCRQYIQNSCKYLPPVSGSILFPITLSIRTVSGASRRTIKQKSLNK